MGKKSKTTVQQAPLPEFVQRQLQQTYNFAQGINPLVYSGDRVAGFTPLEQQAMLLTAQRAMAGDPTVQAAQGLLNKTVQGDFLDNPFLQCLDGDDRDWETNDGSSVVIKAI